MALAGTMSGAPTVAGLHRGPQSLRAASEPSLDRPDPSSSVPASATTPRTTDQGEKKPRAKSKKALAPLALRGCHERSPTAQKLIESAFLLYEDDSRRLRICTRKRGHDGVLSTVHPVLRLKDGTQRCTDGACRCVPDYDAIATLCCLTAQRDDGPERVDGAYVRSRPPLLSPALVGSPLPHRIRSNRLAHLSDSRWTCNPLTDALCYCPDRCRAASATCATTSR